jgi:polysaccharide biosynthesis protein PslH
MRILVCSIEAPLPPVNGFRLYLSALLEGFASKHEVRTLALLAEDQRPESRPVGELRTVSAPPRTRIGAVGSHAGSLLRGRPAGSHRAAGLLRDALEEELRAFQPDVVHVTSGRLAGLAPAVASRPTVLAALDAWHINVDAEARAARGFRGVQLRAQASLVRRLEAGEFRRFDRVVVVTPEDAEALRELDPGLSVTVIPNGVDTAFFRPDPEVPTGVDRITFTGVLSYTPNVDAAEYLARRVFPRVLAARPTARLALVGRDPNPRVQALAALEGVDVVGEVPDLRPWLLSSRAYACTMVSGTGIKNKLLEAMACGLPCVATPLALQGLDVRPGTHVLVGEGDGELATQLERLLADEAEARSLGIAARDYVVRHHSWPSVVERYEELYEDVVQRRRSGD